MTLEEEVGSAIKELKALQKNVESNLRESFEDIEISLAHNLDHLEKERKEEGHFPTKENKKAVEEREITLRRVLKDFNKVVSRTREEIRIREERLKNIEPLKEQLKKCEDNVEVIFLEYQDWKAKCESYKAMVDKLDSSTKAKILSEIVREKEKRGDMHV